MWRDPRIAKAGAWSCDERGQVGMRLEAAHASAASGDVLTAREMCAHLVRDDMLTIEADPQLLVRLAGVLLCAGGLEQLSRVLEAVGGVRVAMLCAKSIRPLTGRDVATCESGGCICIMLDERVVGAPGRSAGADVVRAVIHRQASSQ